MRDTYHQHQCRNNTPRNSDESLEEAILVTQESKESFLDEERGAESSRKGPTKHSTYGEPEHAHRGLESSSPVHQCCRSHHDCVHGKAGREICRACVEISRAEHKSHDEEDSDPGVECEADNSPHQGLAEGADQG